MLQLLPKEILFKILELLEPTAIAKVLATCRHIYQYSKDNYLWFYLAKRQYKMTVPLDDALTFYWLLLAKYGNLLGYWLRLSNPYEGLLQVKCSGYKILGVDIQPPPFPYINLPMKKTPVFEIVLDVEASTVNFNCLIGTGLIEHRCSKQTYLNERWGNILKVFHSVSCDNLRLHSRADLENWWIADLGNVQAINRQFKMETLESQNLSFVYTPLPHTYLSSTKHFGKEFLKPGLYIGSYGVKEFEVVQLAVSGSGNVLRLVCTKIMGDTYKRTAMSRSIEADLTSGLETDFSMPLSPSHLFMGLSMQPIKYSPEQGYLDRFRKKPFFKPQTCTCCRAVQGIIPAEYYAAFKGECTTCSYGSGITHGTFIWFNEHVFGFLCSWKLVIYRHVETNL